MAQKTELDEKVKNNFGSIWFLYLSYFICLGIIPVNLDNLLAYLPGTTLFGLGLMTSTGLLVGTISILFYGYFGDKISQKYNRKLIFFFNCAIWVFASFCAVFSPNFIFAYFLVILTYFGSGVFLPIGFAIIGDTYPPGERGKKYGMMQVGLILGLGAGMIIGLIVGSSFGALGWRLCYLFASVLGIYGLMRYWISGYDPDKGSSDPEFIDLEGQITYDYKITLSKVKEIFKSKTLAAIFLQILLAGIATNVAATWGVFYLSDKLNIENAKLYATFLTLIIGAGALPGSMIGGKLGDKFYDEGKSNGRALVSLVGLTSGVLLLMGFYLLPFMTNSLPELIISLIIMILMGFGGYVLGSFNVGNQYAIFTEVCIPESRGAANALSGIFVNIGGIIGNLILSSLIEQDITLLPFSMGLVLMIWFFGCFLWIIPYFTYPKESQNCRDILTERRNQLKKNS